MGNVSSDNWITVGVCATIAALTVALVVSATRETPQYRAPFYIHDGRTGLCFAVVGGGPVLVACSDAVVRDAQQVRP